MTEVRGVRRPAPAPMAAPAVVQGAVQYPDVPLVLTAAFSLYILVWHLEFGQRIALFAELRFEFLLGLLLTVSAIASVMSRPESSHSALTKYIFAYFVFLVCDLPLSRYFAVSWDAFLNHILKYSCVALFMYAFVRSPRTLRIFMAALLLAFAKIGQEAFLGEITGNGVWQNQGIMRLHGTQGSMFGHPNSLSGFGVSTLPFIYYLFPVVKQRWKVCLAVLAVFTITIIVFTGSRTGYLATVALSGFFWIRSTKRGRLLAVFLIVAAIGLPFVPQEYRARFTSAFEGEAAEGHSKEARIELVQDAWDLFRANPQGLGIYAFQTARVEMLNKEGYDPHNLYLQILVDLGIVGAVVFAALIFSLIRELRATDCALADDERDLRVAIERNPVEDREAGLRHLADVRFMRATTSAFLAYVFARLVLGVFGHDLYEIYWWMASGASIATVNIFALMHLRTQEILGRVVPHKSTATRTSPARPRPPMAVSRHHWGRAT